MSGQGFDDDLSDLIGSTPRPRPPLPETFKPAVERAYTEACPKCGGSGRWGFKRLECFGCKGTGRLTFKTAPEQRERARTYAAGRRENATREHRAETAVWREQHKAEIAWVQAQFDRQTARAHKGQSVFNFPVAMAEALSEYGSWTDNQIAAIRKCMVRDAAYAADRQTRQDARPACDAAKVAEAFQRAREAAERDGEGIMNLCLRLDTFVFTPDRSGTSDIWIKDKEGGAWLGKIVAGKLQRFRACTDEQQERILAAAADPAAAAKAYGQRFKRCSCCGLTLTNPKSRELGIGPICREKWGL